MTNRSKCNACSEDSQLSFEFTMAFQPIVDVEAGRVWGHEALVRGVNGEGAGAILSRVTDENRYRFDQACRVKAIEEARRLFDDENLRLSINFMPNAVYEPAACIRTTLDTARRVGFSRERIMFEFTEDERMTDVAHVANIVKQYRAFGFTTAIDDFGAGYAGLTLLASLKPDLIKIDMQLLRDLHLSRSKQAIVAGIVSIAREIGVTVLGEGVESAAELAAVRATGITLLQGYYFARPAVGQMARVSFESEPSPTYAAVA